MTFDGGSWPRACRRWRGGKGAQPDPSGPGWDGRQLPPGVQRVTTLDGAVRAVCGTVGVEATAR
jgi:hypothetical protein